jgi:hypothetical protein
VVLSEVAVVVEPTLLELTLHRQREAMVEQVRPHLSQGLPLLAAVVAAAVAFQTLALEVLAALAAAAQRALVEYRTVLTEPQTQAAAVAALVEKPLLRELTRLVVLVVLV